jgi:L-fuculose-phosphate aldolase
VARVYGELGRLGLITGGSGNVSHRVQGGMIITPSGADPARATRADLVFCDFDGGWSGRTRPSSEWAMHAAIYARTPEAGCVAHTHAPACTALACLDEPLPAFHYLVVQFGGETVPCAPYVTFGTPELAELVAATIFGHSACLLANHGMVVWGRDAETALGRAVLLEELCARYLLARSAGAPRLLTPGEMAAARERFRDYGPAASSAAIAEPISGPSGRSRAP